MSASPPNKVPVSTPAILTAMHSNSCSLSQGEKLKMAPSSLQLKHLNAPLILSFLENLESARGNKAASRNVRLRSNHSCDSSSTAYRRRSNQSAGYSRFPPRKLIYHSSV